MVVPEKYVYLADNAAKCNQSKSWKPKAAAVREARKRALKKSKLNRKKKQQEVDDTGAMDISDQGGEGAPSSAEFMQESSKDGDIDMDEEEDEEN
jgi:hypothetical protein